LRRPTCQTCSHPDRRGGTGGCIVVRIVRHSERLFDVGVAAMYDVFVSMLVWLCFLCDVVMSCFFWGS